MALRKLLALGLLLTGCGLLPEPPAPALRLVEKGRYQALYRPDGTLERLVHDRDGDRRADVVTLFDAHGTPLRNEIDSDGDGAVDRWEYLSGRRPQSVATSSRGGAPDAWELADAAGAVTRRESDDDGDGRPDRAEVLAAGVLLYEEFDTDKDGRMDRRVLRAADGAVLGVEADADGDGRFERALPARR